MLLVVVYVNFSLYSNRAREERVILFYNADV